MKLTSTALVSLLGLGLLAACSSESPPPTLAPDVDLSRYAGRWYVITNIPYFAEKGMSAVTSTSPLVPPTS
jgi:apolipoprotein D and lipocalin family protein